MKPVIRCLDEFRVGQIWRNKRQKATACFVIRELAQGVYVGNSSVQLNEKVYGLQVDDDGVRNRELHPSSLSQMFPYLTFNPTIEYEEVL